MIEKMTKYSFILLKDQKDEFLDKLQELGVVDIKRSTKPVDETSADLFGQIESVKAEIACIVKGTDNRLSEMEAERAELEKTLADVQPWGEFDKAKLESLGLDVKFYNVPEKQFDPSWKETTTLEVINNSDGRVQFVTLGGGELPVKETSIPEVSPSAAAEALAAKVGEIEDYKAALESRKSEIPELQKKIDSLNADLSRYFAEIKGEAAVEATLLVYEGYAPAAEKERLDSELDNAGLFFISEDAVVDDNPPIKLKNNKFVAMFETLTDMYGRPAYNGFDPTPYISIFFLLFFAMCMGDMGYGLILVIVGFLLKKVKGFASMAPLVVTLGVGTTIVGFLFHTFFSVDISQWECLSAVKGCFVPAQIAGFDGTMVIAIIVGVLHLCLAMVVKAIYAVKNNGFLGSLGTLGWTLLIVGGTVIGAGALIGVLGTQAAKIAIIVIGVIAAIGIFPLNTIGRNPLINIGSGLWETYNTATGLLGDVLSYLRLYALGLAGAMLGFAFNDLAKMTLGDSVASWIPFVLIVVIGHTLNVAMCALGAFVHPLRLNFLEFFKNSGYEAAGAKYNPLKK